MESTSNHFPVSSGCEHQLCENTGDDSALMPQMLPSQNDKTPAVSVQELVKRRLELLNQLSESPNNYLAQLELEDCESHINQWALSNRTPGIFYGSTNAPVTQNRGVKTFDQVEAESLPDAHSRKQYVKSQPWFTKDKLTAGQKITSGKGRQLLLRMGWLEGSGLGKRGDGPSEHVVLPENFRSSLSRRGLAASDGELVSSTSVASTSNENSNNHNLSSPITGQTNNKHPVTELTKYCAKKHYEPPEFIEVLSFGPAHRPRFLVKVRVNGVEYQPSQPSTSKRDAKKEASVKCLLALGLWSNNDVMQPFQTQKWRPSSSTS